MNESNRIFIDGLAKRCLPDLDDIAFRESSGRIKAKIAVNLDPSLRNDFSSFTPTLTLKQPLNRRPKRLLGIRLGEMK